MPKMIVSCDDIVIKEVQLTKDRTSLGRRPYNDIVIDNLAVSGEHAVVQISGAEVFLEDLHSTNGSSINGKAVKKQLLQNKDVIEIGKFKIQFLSESENSGLESQHTSDTAAVSRSAASFNACIKVMSGVAAGREIALVKVVTTIGKPGQAVASIDKRAQGFVLVHVEGLERPLLNGSPIGEDAALLKNGDSFMLAGTEMQFLQI
jgi:hypothetical protein